MSIKPFCHPRHLRCGIASQWSILGELGAVCKPPPQSLRSLSASLSSSSMYDHTYLPSFVRIYRPYLRKPRQLSNQCCGRFWQLWCTRAILIYNPCPNGHENDELGCHIYPTFGKICVHLIARMSLCLGFLENKRWDEADHSLDTFWVCNDLEI